MALLPTLSQLAEVQMSSNLLTASVSFMISGIGIYLMIMTAYRGKSVGNLW